MDETIVINYYFYDNNGANLYHDAPMTFDYANNSVNCCSIGYNDVENLEININFIKMLLNDNDNNYVLAMPEVDYNYNNDADPTRYHPLVFKALLKDYPSLYSCYCKLADESVVIFKSLYLTPHINEFKQY